MKSKKLFTSIFLTLILCSFLGVFAPTSIGVNGAVVSPDSVFYISPYVMLEGFQPELSASMMSSSLQFIIGLDDVYNDSLTPFGLIGESFFVEDIAPKDYASDGITREFSSDISSKLDLDSGAGIYQTLQGISEIDFSQHAVERDTTTFSYTRNEAFNDTIVADLQDVDPEWNITHFDCRKAYIVFTLDKVMVDAFFAAAKAKDGYALISDEHSTNTQMITTLLDDLWPDFLLDFIYSTVNMTELETGITISEEIEAVLKTNSTDFSVNGTKRLVSMRNAAIGFIGQKLASQSTVELDSYPVETNSPFFGFEQTSTTYSFNLDIKADICTGNTVDESMTVTVGGMQLGAEVTIFGASINLGWLIFIAVGTTLVVGVITYLIIKNSKDRVAISMLVGLGAGLFAALIYFIIAYVTTVTIT